MKRWNAMAISGASASMWASDAAVRRYKLAGRSVTADAERRTRETQRMVASRRPPDR